MDSGQRALAAAAKQIERERWTLSYIAHNAQALRRRVLAVGNGRSVQPASDTGRAV